MDKKIERFNYNNKQFTTVSNTSNGEVSGKTTFYYHQDGEVIWADYSGGDILKGLLIGKVLEDGNLEFSYQHLNTAMEIKVGVCESTPEVLQDGRLRMYETWQWLNGDHSKGQSMIEEVNRS